MSPVRRREPRKARRGLLWAALILALLVAAGLWYALRSAPVELPPQSVAVPVTLSDREIGEIAAITVENGGGVYTLLPTDAGWRLADADYPLREELLSALVQDAALVAAEDTVGDLREQPAWRLADFGLDTGCVRVAVDFTDGGRVVFRVGDSVPQEIPARYLYVEGDSHIYTVSADVYDAYITTPLELHAVSDPALKGDLIDRIAFSGERPFVMAREADGWYLTEPVRYPLSDAAVGSLLKKLEGLRFAQYAADGGTAELAAYGLEPPERTVTLDIAESVLTGYDQDGQPLAETRLPAYQLTLELGRMDGDVVFYCRYKGDILKATAFSAGFLRTQGYDALLLTAPFNAPTNDLRRLTWQETVYDLSLQERVLPNNRLETDEDGNILYDVVVERDGQPVDSDAFLTAYRGLLELRTVDRLPADYALPEEAPLLRVNFTRQASGREICLYPLDALHRAVTIDGVALFQVEKGWGETIKLP